MNPSQLDDTHVVGLDSVEELYAYMCAHSTNAASATLSNLSTDSFRQISTLRLRIMDIKKGKGGAKGGKLTFKYFSQLNSFASPSFSGFSSSSSSSSSSTSSSSALCLSTATTSLASWKSFNLPWKTIALRTFSTRSHVKGYRCGRCAAEYFDDGDGFFIVSEDDERSAKVLGVLENCSNSSERNPTYLLSSGSVPTTGAIITLRVYHRDAGLALALASMVCSVDHVAMEIVDADSRIDIKSGMRNKVVAKIRPDYAAKKRAKSKTKKNAGIGSSVSSGSLLPTRTPSTRTTRTPAKYTEVDEEEDDEDDQQELEDPSDDDRSDDEQDNKVDRIIKMSSPHVEDEDEKKSHPTISRPTSMSIAASISMSMPSTSSNAPLIQLPHPVNPRTASLAVVMSQSNSRRNSFSNNPLRSNPRESSPFELEDLDSDSSSTTSSSSHSTPRAIGLESDLMSSSTCAIASSSSAASTGYSATLPSLLSASSSASFSYHMRNNSASGSGINGSGQMLQQAQSTQLPSLTNPSLRPLHSSFVTSLLSSASSSSACASTSASFGGNSYANINISSSPSLTCQPFSSLPSSENDFSLTLNCDSLFYPSLDRANSIPLEDTMNVQQNLSVVAKTGLKRGHSEGNQGNNGIAASVGASTSLSASGFSTSAAISSGSLSSKSNLLAVTELTEAQARQDGYEVPKRRRLFSNPLSNLNNAPLEKHNSLSLAPSPVNDEISTFMKFDRTDSLSLSSSALAASSTGSSSSMVIPIIPALSSTNPAIVTIATNNFNSQQQQLLQQQQQQQQQLQVQNLHQFWNTQLPYSSNSVYSSASVGTLSHGGHSYPVSSGSSSIANLLPLLSSYSSAATVASLCPPSLGRVSSIDNVPSLNITMTPAYP